MIIEDGDLRQQALDQFFAKLCDGGGLLLDKVLQVLNQAHLFVLDHAVNLGLLPHVPESEDLIRDGIVGEKFPLCCAVRKGCTKTAEDLLYYSVQCALRKRYIQSVHHFTFILCYTAL